MTTAVSEPEARIALKAKCRNKTCPAKIAIPELKMPATSTILASWRQRYQEYRCLWCDGKVTLLETEEEVRA